MVSKSLRIVLDSNILISAYVFGGKPEFIFNLIIDDKIKGITSNVLISEFIDVLRKKFGVIEEDILEIQDEINEAFQVVYPTQTIDIVKDKDDNRVLEAAVKGNCNFIVTGDKELLKLHLFKGIAILSSDEFISYLNKENVI